MSNHPGEIPSISIHDLPDNAQVLDVREDDEWAQGRAPHARHIPLGDLPSRLGELEKDERVAVVCRSGGRSSRAVAFLRGQGYDAVNVEGGMQAWARSNRPMTHDGPGAPQVG